MMPETVPWGDQARAIEQTLTNSETPEGRPSSGFGFLRGLTFCPPPAPLLVCGPDL